MQRISHQRMIVYILLLGLAPLILVSMHLFAKLQEQEQLGLSLDEAMLQAKQKIAKEARNKDVRQLYSNTDSYYIDKEIETLPLLQQETQELSKLLQHGFPQEEERLKKRLQFLKEQNKIVCSEGSVKAYATFKETIESFPHPVEVDASDIKTILQKVEGPHPEGAPHLIITDFKLERKKGTSQEVYSLDMKMLKREYTK
jgi:hypothetical protein